MRLRNLWVGVVGLMLATSLVACGGSKKSDDADDVAEAGAAAGGGGGPKVDAATAADVKGVVSLDGMAPANAPIKMNADPKCLEFNKTPQFQETYEVGSDGKSLANVFVYVKDGLGNYSYDMPTEPARIIQENCRYHAHVFGVRVGQPLEIVNGDDTLHNIHAQPKVNQEFNNGQPIKGMKMTHTFTAKEIMVPFKCDVHGWMNAFVGVMDNPYFAVTDKDGKFDLPNLPPGTYTIEAWHEKLGTMEQKITVAAKDSKEITFSFKPTVAASN